MLGNKTDTYRLSIYSEIYELSKDKVYMVKSSLDDKIYIKKILYPDNYEIYAKLKSLSLPNIPKIYEILEFDGRLVVIEEYINGSTIDAMLKESNTIPESGAIQIILDLIEVLNLLHSCDPPIIHRDIKPSNIMINNDGILKLIDFDVSRTHKADESTDTEILGTYGYAAPEQFGFSQSDIRTDIYSLGITMNMMLVGKFPLDCLYEGDLSHVVSTCIKMDPEQRFQNVNEIREAILNKKSTKAQPAKLNKYKLPGFKSGRLSFKIISTLWYVFLFLGFIGQLTEDTSFESRVGDAAFSLFLFVLTLLYGNFNNIKSKLPLIKSDQLSIKIIGYVLYTLSLLLLCGFFL